MKCKYCRKYSKRKKNPRTEQQEGGGWDPKKNAGIIIGHGNIQADKFIIIPEGISLRPFSRLSQSFNVNDMTNPGTWMDFREYFQDKEDRSSIFNLEQSDFNVGHIYKAGDIIPEMNIKMELTWPSKGEQKGQRLYFPAAGVITERKILSMDLQLAPSVENMNNIKEQIWNLSDPELNLEWNRTYSLSTILKKIVQAKKQGPYWILSCRAGDVVSEEIECGKESLRKDLSSSIDVYPNIFEGFEAKVKNLDKFVKKISPSMEAIKEPFIQKLKEYILEKRYDIDTDLLCTVQNIIAKGIIDNDLVNFTRDYSKTTFFKDFWNRYEKKRRPPSKLDYTKIFQ